MINHRCNVQIISDTGDGFDPERSALKQLLTLLITGRVEWLITADHELLAWGDGVIPAICEIRRIEVIDLSR